MRHARRAQKRRYDKQDLLTTYGSPDAPSPRGNWRICRDLLSRLVYGARVSMSVGLASAAIVLSVSVPTGPAAGYFGSTFDLLLMRVVDIVYAIPYLLLVVLLQTFFLCCRTLSRRSSSWATLLVPIFIIQPPPPRWGLMIAEGVDAIESHPRLVIAPALMLAATLPPSTSSAMALAPPLDPSSDR